ncbi:PilN domain-containing protein [Gimesia aquarii]|uniref:Fimbrial assembly protein (PilN) n=1 Tax=Gimesia aquarii TaxID=2527964 RepID=A0A517W4Y9_9PLAN|nr:PilN domain-containing protein [Gimesia aquarii]QDU00314.1 hypothetical protein V144x_58270 [Gimesia aquarii]
MIPEIDFLPASYREVRRRHRNRIWRRTIVLIFLVLVTLGTVRQREIQHNLLTQKKDLEERARLMNAQLEDPDQLNQKIKVTEIRANLLAALQLDESPAQLLSIISSTLPEFVSLDEFHFSFEKVFVKKKSKPDKVPDKDVTEMIPALVDLQNLKEQHARENLVINVQGMSPDHLSISHYMSNLDQLGLFREIDLVQSNEMVFEGQPMRVFRLRIVVNAPGMYVPQVNHRSTAGLDLSITGGFKNE